jgi:hypothetical protein
MNMRENYRYVLNEVGDVQQEIQRITSLNGSTVYHQYLTARLDWLSQVSNLFCLKMQHAEINTFVRQAQHCAELYSETYRRRHRLLDTDPEYLTLRPVTPIQWWQFYAALIQLCVPQELWPSCGIV